MFIQVNAAWKVWLVLSEKLNLLQMEFLFYFKLL